ncbi:MAG: hypothetical protein IJ758_03205 [Clostridia bacterium]|nr:hypothetical protein [Clostridia bacterium]
MTELNTDKLKSVSGRGSWSIGSLGTSNGKTYFLDSNAVDTLTEMGYHIGSTLAPAIAGRKVGRAADVTDTYGKPIGDQLMREIFGEPSPIIMPSSGPEVDLV